MEILELKGNPQRNKVDALHDDCAHAGCSLHQFGLSLLLPLQKFSLPLYTLVESGNIRRNTLGDGIIDLVLGSASVIGGFLSLVSYNMSIHSCQVADTVSHKAHKSCESIFSLPFLTVCAIIISNADSTIIGLSSMAFQI